MSAIGFTPIQLYRSTTAAAAPTAGNLAAGELAINLTDEKLYFKNASGVVKVLADSTYVGTVTSVAASGGTTGLTFSGSPITGAGTLTLSGTLGVANGGTGATTLTSGRLLRGNGTGAITASLVADDGTTVTVNGPLSVPANIDMGARLTTGVLVVTGDAAIEVGGARTGSGPAYIDLHAVASTDFEARIIRYAGANGGMDIINLGTGGITVSAEGAGDVVVKTNATERMRVVNNGNVGIGTSSPGSKLDVTGGSITLGTNNNGYYWRDTGGSQPFIICQNDNNIVFYSTDATGGARAVFSVVARNSTSPFSINLPLQFTNTIADTSSTDPSAPGFRGMPQNAQTGAYTLALTDSGKHISNTTGGFVIPANGSVAFPVGSTIVLFNNSASTQSVSITTDTLRQAGTTNTGTRTLAAYGLATCVKVASTTWVISGNVT